ncbi:hypothetical protein RCL1_001909 [Eukaryota sp. TZLM3-RCL]
MTNLFKGKGRKKRKDRITLVLTTNMTGTKKFPFYVIGKSERPHAMKNINLRDANFVYRSNKKAWLYSHNFEEICMELHNYCAEHNIVGALLCDNVSTHRLSDEIELNNLNIIFLPPNTTSVLQPLDAGIIRSLKAKYRRQYLNFILDELECGDNLTYDEANAKVTILNALEWASESWDEIEPKLIQNSWIKVNLFNKEQEIIEDNELPLENLERLELHDPIFAEIYVNPDFEREGGETENEEDIVDSVAAIFNTEYQWRSEGEESGEEGDYDENVIFPTLGRKRTSDSHSLQFNNAVKNTRLDE